MAIKIIVIMSCIIVIPEFALSPSPNQESLGQYEVFKLLVLIAMLGQCKQLW